MIKELLEGKKTRDVILGNLVEAKKKKSKQSYEGKHLTSYTVDDIAEAIADGFHSFCGGFDTWKGSMYEEYGKMVKTVDGRFDRPSTKSEVELAKKIMDNEWEEWIRDQGYQDGGLWDDDMTDITEENDNLLDDAIDLAFDSAYNLILSMAKDYIKKKTRGKK